MSEEPSKEGPHIVYERIEVPSEMVERNKDSWRVKPTEYNKDGKEVHRRGYRAHAHEKRYREGPKTETRKELKYNGNFDSVSDKIAREYEEKGYSEKEAKEIGKDTASDVYREKMAKNYKNAAIIAVLAIVIISGMGFAYSYGNSTGVKAINTPWAISNGIDPQLNITFNSISYVDEPPQWNFTAANQAYPGASWTTGGDYILNNSGYLIMQNNTTGSTSGFAQLSFNVGGYLGSTVSYLATVNKLAFNGTSTTGYIVLSEDKQTGIPSTTSNVIGTSAGAAQNILFIEYSYSSTGKNYTITVGYYSYNSAKYDNYTSKAFTTGLNPLVFGTFEIDMMPSVSYVNYTNPLNGSLIESSGAIYPVLESNLSKVAYNSYELPSAASSSNTSMILSYGLLIDHNTYSYAASNEFAPQVLASSASSLAFDPGSTNSSYTQEPNATVSGVASYNGSTSFGTVLTSNSTSIYQATALNTSLSINNVSKDAEYNGSQAITTLRATNSNGTQVTANLNIYSWNANGIQNTTMNFLQTYISGKLNGEGIATSPNDIFISGYVISNISVDVSFSNSTASQITDALDNAFPSFLAAQNLTVVNTTTSAVVAGAEVGSFYHDGMAVQAIINHGQVVNPFTYQVYKTPELAGFPKGTFVSGNYLNVPQAELFIGPGGNLILTQDSLLGSFFSSLTSAGQAVNGLFKEGASTVSNAVGAIAKPISGAPQYMIKTLTNTLPRAYTDLGQNVSKLESTLLPSLSMIPQNIESDLGRGVSNLGGLVSTTVSKTSSGIADFRSEAIGALASGVHTFSNGIYSVGSYVNNGVHNAGSVITNTLGKVVNTGEAVLSPVYTSVSTLPHDITGFATGAVRSVSSAVKGALQDGQAALDQVGNYVSKSATGVLSMAQNALGKVGSSIAAFGGTLKNDLGSIGNFFVGLGHGILTVLEYVGVGVVIVAIIIVIAFVLKSRAKAMPGSVSLN